MTINFFEQSPKLLPDCVPNIVVGTTCKNSFLRIL